MYEGVAQGNRGRVKLFGNKLTDYKGMYQEVIAYDPWLYELVTMFTASSGTAACSPPLVGVAAWSS